jgi:hypothetical protein
MKQQMNQLSAQQSTAQHPHGIDNHWSPNRKRPDNKATPTKHTYEAYTMHGHYRPQERTVDGSRTQIPYAAPGIVEHYGTPLYNNGQMPQYPHTYPPYAQDTAPMFLRYPQAAGINQQLNFEQENIPPGNDPPADTSGQTNSP